MELIKLYIKVFEDISKKHPELSFVYGDDILLDMKTLLLNVDTTVLEKEKDIVTDPDTYEKMYHVIGYFESSSKLLSLCYPDDITYIYFAVKKGDTDKYNELYIGIDYLLPGLWHKMVFTDTSTESVTNTIENIISKYNCTQYLSAQDTNYKTIRGFIGTEHMLETNFCDFEKLIIANDFYENFMWGSRWTDYPFRDEILNKSFSNLDLARMSTHALKQMTYNYESISVRTKASKSLITFENRGSAIIVDIKYIPITNDDVPLDLIMTLFTFPSLNHVELINLLPLTYEQILIATDVANTEQMYTEVIQELQKVIHKINNNEYTKETITNAQEIKELAQKIVDTFTVNLKLEKINHEQLQEKIERLKTEKITSKIKVIKLVEWIIRELKLENCNDFVKSYLLDMYMHVFITPVQVQQKLINN